MNHDEQDELWELLEKAPLKKASPFFANKVMHAIHRKEERVTFLAWLRRWWLVPMASAACAALLATAALKNTTTPSVSGGQIAKADPLTEMVSVISESEEYDTSLSDLLANEDQSVWLAADPSSLF